MLKQRGFSLILILIVVGSLVGVGTVLVVSNKEKAGDQPADQRPTDVESVAEEPPPEEKGPETTPPDQPPAGKDRVSFTADPQKDPSDFCKRYASFCVGSIVNTTLLCQTNPNFCAQKQIVLGQPVRSQQPPSPTRTGQIPVIGNVDPRTNPTQFCQLNPIHCSGGSVNTGLLCARNPAFCLQKRIVPGQIIKPGQQTKQQQIQKNLLHPLNPINKPQGNVNPKQNPSQFCRSNPRFCIGNSVQTTRLCATNPVYCTQKRIIPGQIIKPGYQQKQQRIQNQIPDVIKNSPYLLKKYNPIKSNPFLQKKYP